MVFENRVKIDKYISLFREVLKHLSLSKYIMWRMWKVFSRLLEIHVAADSIQNQNNKANTFKKNLVIRIHVVFPRIRLSSNIRYIPSTRFIVKLLSLCRVFFWDAFVETNRTLLLPPCFYQIKNNDNDEENVS